MEEQKSIAKSKNVFIVKNRQLRSDNNVDHNIM